MQIKWLRSQIGMLETEGEKSENNKQIDLGETLKELEEGNHLAKEQEKILGAETEIQEAEGEINKISKIRKIHKIETQ
jgi:exonuclease VII small subunit